ncbi:MAG: hypothetical protein GY778_03120 [bacterium]|nr:hypothetical protein [bacterium]
MLDRIIEQKELLALVDELSRQRMAVGPVPREDRFVYERIEQIGQLDLGFNYCVYGPRKYLFPPHEVLLTFSAIEGQTHAVPQLAAEPLAIVGVHPCDLNAIRLLDRVFAQNHRDEHYLARRAETMIIGIDCGQPCTEGVFCTDMKSNEAAEGFDLMCYPLPNGADGDVRYGVVFGSDTGREWLLYSQAGSSPSVEDERALERFRQEKAAAFSKTLACDLEELPDLLDRSYDSLLWEATARRCYSCGSCNLSCPTCYCFNVSDDLDITLTSGRRYREWDGCQIKNFATVTGEHNFRPKAASRLRHRIYRKGKWVREREGLPGCVGCARCDRACTAKINSVEIYNQLAEEE